jgi:hypothetical protein
MKETLLEDSHIGDSVIEFVTMRPTSHSCDGHLRSFSSGKSIKT